MVSRVLEPIRIGACEVPHHIARTAHGTHCAHEDITDDFIAYHLPRAKGRCGLSTRHAQLTPYVETTQRTTPAMERSVQHGFTLMVRS